MESDALLENLKTLETPPLDGALAERVRLRARAALAAEPRRAPTGRRLAVLARAAMPVLVTSAAAAHLVWVSRVLADLGR